MDYKITKVYGINTDYLMNDVIAEFETDEKHIIIENHYNVDSELNVYENIYTITRITFDSNGCLLMFQKTEYSDEKEAIKTYYSIIQDLAAFEVEHRLL